MLTLRYKDWRLAFRPGPTLLAFIATVAMVLLGNWQTRRAEEKLAAQQRFDALASGPVLSLAAERVAAADYEHSRVAVRGEFLGAKTFFVDNRVLRGVPGYHVVTPLKIRGGDLCVLVNRGWIAAGPTRDRLPAVRTPAGEIVLEGLAVVPPPRVYELGRDAATGPLVEHLILSRIAERTGLALQPVVLLQTSESDDGLARAWERPDAGVDTHRAYALQWYALGVLSVVLFVSLNLERVRGVE